MTVNGDKAPGSGLCASSGRKGVEEAVDGGQGTAIGGTEVREKRMERACGTEDGLRRLFRAVRDC